jgi:hypothetical protein
MGLGFSPPPASKVKEWRLLEAAMRDGLLRYGLPEWKADGLIEDYAHYRRREAFA